MDTCPIFKLSNRLKSNTLIANFHNLVDFSDEKPLRHMIFIVLQMSQVLRINSILFVVKSNILIEIWCSFVQIRGKKTIPAESLGRFVLRIGKKSLRFKKQINLGLIERFKSSKQRQLPKNIHVLPAQFAICFILENIAKSQEAPSFGA